MRSVMFSLDGALRSWDASMTEPYSDRPDTRGPSLVSASAFQSVVESTMKAGYQVSISSSGDRANRLALDTIEAARAAVGLDMDLRPRIEHADILVPFFLSFFFPPTSFHQRFPVQ